MTLNENLFRSIVEAAPIGILIQTKGKIEYINDLFLRWLDADAKTIREQAFLSIVHPVDRNRVNQEIESADEFGRELPTTVKLLTASGETLTVDLTLRLLRGSAPDGRDYVIICAINTEGRIAEERAMNSLREGIVALVTRELRDPVQIILMHSHLLLRFIAAGVNVGPASSIYGIQKSAIRIGQISGDMLDTFMLQLKKVPLHKEPINLSLAIAGAVERLRLQENFGPIQIHVEGDIPMLNMDPVRLEQIILNLLRNAFQRNPEQKGIEARIRLSGMGILISISDNSDPIPAEQASRIFDLGTQLKAHRFDFGLYIAKGLIEVHGGKIWLEPGTDKGNVFHVWLPTNP